MVSTFASADFKNPSDETLVLIAGDWHSNANWMGRVIPAAARTRARTILHVGDFGFWPGHTQQFLDTIEFWCDHTATNGRGIERIAVVPGNHDDASMLDPLFEANPGHPVQLSARVWALPRGYRFEVGGRSFLAFGGAASIDRMSRSPGRTWWPSEVPSWDEVDRAVAGDHADVLLTHDASYHLTPQVKQLIENPDPWWTREELEYANSARPLVAAVVDATTPLIQCHGHFHLRDSASFERDGLPPLRVESLHRDGSQGNLVVLNTATLRMTDVKI